MSMLRHRFRHSQICVGMSASAGMSGRPMRNSQHNPGIPRAVFLTCVVYGARHRPSWAYLFQTIRGSGSRSGGGRSEPTWDRCGGRSGSRGRWKRGGRLGRRDTAGFVAARLQVFDRSDGTHIDELRLGVVDTVGGGEHHEHALLEDFIVPLGPAVPGLSDDVLLALAASAGGQEQDGRQDTRKWNGDKQKGLGVDSQCSFLIVVGLPPEGPATGSGLHPSMSRNDVEGAGSGCGARPEGKSGGDVCTRPPWTAAPSAVSAAGAGGAGTPSLSASNLNQIEYTSYRSGSEISPDLPL